MKPYLRRLRRLLLLVPAAFRHFQETGQGLPVKRALKLTGLGTVKELEEDVSAVTHVEASPTMSEDFLHVGIDGDRVFVDAAMGLVRPPPLTLREGAMLLAALRPFERERALAPLVRKVRRAIPEELRGPAERLARATELQTRPPGEWADSLAEAIERRAEVEVEYRAESAGETRARVLEPRLVFPQDGHWYLAAWDVARQEEHLYRLDRIVSVVIGERRFGDHKGPPLLRYRIRHLYFESGRERDVRIRFTGLAALAALERWPTASREADGSALVTARVTSGNYLFGWVLGWGGQAEIEAPAEARAGLLARAEELQRIYAA